jgi:hypothetical protein
MDMEKVIEHITDCVKIADCQINHNWVFVRTDILRDALALLKAQEPRVMDFDDVVSGDECYLEAINGARGYADCYACTGTGEVQVFRCNFDNPQYIKASDYMKTWRCWTQRPTDEQREAIQWAR